MNLVFDFGAVVFSWKPVDLVAEFFPDHAATYAQAGDLAHQLFGHADWHAFDRGTATMADTVARSAARLGLAHAALTRLVACIGERLVPLPESAALVQQLQAMRGQATPPLGVPLRLYYLSNMPVPYARALQRLHGFLNDFDGGVFSGDVQLIKPEPAIYQCLQSRYALEPEHTIFIDDLEANVLAARAQGWHGIHFQSANQLALDLRVFNFNI